MKMLLDKLKRKDLIEIKTNGHRLSYDEIPNRINSLGFLKTNLNLIMSRNL